MKSLFDNLAARLDKIVGTPDTATIYPNDKTHYWLMAVVLLAMACLLLLMVYFVEYCMKLGLKIP